jgi:GNAT superfamily N-acetyltransferase
MDGNREVAVAVAPAIPGLAFRRFHSPTDAPAMLAVRLGSLAHDQIDPRSPRERPPTLDELARALADCAPSSPNLLVATIGGQVAGYSRVAWWPEQDGQAVFLHLGYLLPEWRGRGIGGAMFAWAEARCRVLAAEVLAREAREMRPCYATNASSTEREATGLIERAGYHVVRRLADMRLEHDGPVPEMALPAGIEPRPVTPAHYRAIYDAMKDAWQGLWGQLPPGEEDYRAFLADRVDLPYFDPALWQIAWDGELVAGLVLGELRDGVGVVAEVAVRRAYRRRGIARSLLVAALRQLEARRPEQVRIYTDAEDGQGARSLYESVGFRTLKEHRLYRKPMELPDV